MSLTKDEQCRSRKSGTGHFSREGRGYRDRQVFGAQRSRRLEGSLWVQDGGPGTRGRSQSPDLGRVRPAARPGLFPQPPSGQPACAPRPRTRRGHTARRKLGLGWKRPQGPGAPGPAGGLPSPCQGVASDARSRTPSPARFRSQVAGPQPPALLRHRFPDGGRRGPSLPSGPRPRPFPDSTVTRLPCARRRCDPAGSPLTAVARALSADRNAVGNHGPAAWKQTWGRL